MKVPKSVVFEIYGRKYTIKQIRLEGGILRGYCKKRRKWVWIIDNSHLLFDGEFPIVATRIS